MKENSTLPALSSKNFFILLFLLFFTSTNSEANTEKAEKKIYGVYEYVLLLDDNVKVKAKLDTGALTSSLSATNITYFKKNNKDWVRFTPMINSKEAIEPIEKEIIKYSKIKLRSEEHSKKKENNNDIKENFIKRPVVKIKICFDGKKRIIEVNLTDRRNFNYPLLLGLKTLRTFKALINPNHSFQAKNTCKMEN